ncbi:MAG: UDP-2-acetamido-2-deoxy-3-oxo-D-glucuronate aminotransferase [Microgenomates bacterium OLB23]|nr:MAG: UDP-2-acetamido-2-deoxy-3-oxo-D-glucuronate aminotransferase [Microgenomates bacterium OLB23]
MIPFIDFQNQYSTIHEEVNEAIQRVLQSQFFILGPETEAFEKELADYLGSKHVVTVNSGTDALIFALRILEIGPGDEVITPANSFIATALAITEVGATPVFVDINPDTYELDIDQTEKKISSRTKAILPVHLYGLPANIVAISKNCTGT